MKLSHQSLLILNETHDLSRDPSTILSRVEAIVPSRNTVPDYIITTFGRLGFDKTHPYTETALKIDRERLKYPDYTTNARKAMAVAHYAGKLAMAEDQDGPTFDNRQIALIMIAGLGHNLPETQGQYPHQVSTFSTLTHPTLKLFETGTFHGLKTSGVDRVLTVLSAATKPENRAMITENYKRGTQGDKAMAILMDASVVEDVTYSAHRESKLLEQDKAKVEQTPLITYASYKCGLTDARKELLNKFDSKRIENIEAMLSVRDALQKLNSTKNNIRMGKSYTPVPVPVPAFEL